MIQIPRNPIDRSRRSRHPGGEYDRWIERYDTLHDDDRRLIRAHLSRLSYQPVISVVMPTYDPPEAFFREAVASVSRQLYTRWELCIADDASPSVMVQRLVRELACKDPRIKFFRREVNGNISVATNTALALASGTFVALMDHDDVLSERALYEVVVELNAHPDADVLYSDEDRIDDAGKRMDPYFKTDWNPELFLGQNVISHLGVYRRALVEAVGGLREGYEGSQDYDLALRVTSATHPDKIRHIPSILYHWRQASEPASFSQAQLDRCVAAARRAKSEFLQARHEDAVVLPNPMVPNLEWVRRRLPTPPPLVSIIGDVRLRTKELIQWIEAFLEATDYARLEMLVIGGRNDAESIDLDTPSRRPGRDVKLAAMSNHDEAIRSASGDVFCFVNERVRPMEPDWLSELVSIAVHPQAGFVGGKLRGSRETQQGHLITSLPHIAHASYRNAGTSDIGYHNRLALSANVSAVSSSCFVVRKSVYDAAKEHASREPPGLRAVGLCLAAREAGYLNVWTPFAQLRLCQPNLRTRVADAAQRLFASAARLAFKRKWKTALAADPFFSPNLSYEGPGRLAFPPRRTQPWRATTIPRDMEGKEGAGPK